MVGTQGANILTIVSNITNSDVVFGEQYCKYLRREVNRATLEAEQEDERPSTEIVILIAHLVSL